MIEDREIWACANQLLRQHGRHACPVTAQRAGELLALGDISGHRTFLRILERIRLLKIDVSTGTLN
jgi:hypothetical protein